MDHPSQEYRTKEDLNDKLWLVVRSLKSSGEKIDYHINKNDIIKLGRVKFRVRDLKSDLDFI